MESNPHLSDHFQDWLLLQNIIARDYMCHRAIIQTMHKWAWKQEKKGLRVLDLGCGDCYAARSIFKGVNDVQYYGIDLSNEVLGIARSNFEASNWNIELLNGDLTEMIRQLHGPFDFVIAGYALHYLENRQKSAILDNIRLVLSPRGTLMIYDLLPRNGEKKDAYIQRVLDDADANWNLLSPEQLSSFRQHLENRAFPIDQTTWQQFAFSSSLGKGELIFRDSAEQYGIIEFSN